MCPHISQYSAYNTECTFERRHYKEGRKLKGNLCRLMTMKPMYPCGKPCSRGTHNETVKHLALSKAYDRLNHDRKTAVALFNGCSSERKCNKYHVKQTFHQRNLV